ncbi:unnamed protein product [Candidula unifasciata]|uniref:Cadherin domain-containing protein n=1 Tax=Candidula unifasciata TaxID=100452 RepID=A0A8S3Z880_9EUPU|nr:unnamed protein product [Candidula unifasciata]
MATVGYATVVILLGLVSLVLSQPKEPTFTIYEELPISTEVGNITNITSVFSGLTDQEKASLQYGILSQAGSPGSLFNISKTGGNIYVAKRIDREALCFMKEKCVLRIDVVVSAQLQFNSRFLTVNFEILDINDNAPTFENSAVVLTIPEGNSLNSSRKINGANDMDFNPTFRLKNYTLDNFHDVFALTTSQTLDGSSNIDLILTKSLDRETKAQYVFTVTAYDGGSPSRSSTLSVTVNVTDINDNAPVFLNSSYDITIEGKTAPNAVILQVSADDADEAANALVTYHFSNLQKQMLANPFNINSSTGEISVSGHLRSGISEFIVEAQDSGTPRLKSQTVVRVNVVNSGNTPPRVSITQLGANSDQNTVSIQEPGWRGLFVVFAVVEDDGDDNVACQINNELFNMEHVPSKGYSVQLQEPVDRETTPSYDLTITCTDSGNPPLNTSVNLLVRIEDANDNAPVFTQQRYSRTISEGQKNEEFVLQVSASDKDAGANGAVRYSIDPTYSKYFSIDPDSGVITAIGNLDRELTPGMRFKVYATDQGKPQELNGHADVFVVLNDVNDNAPELKSKVFRFQTVEEQEGTRIIGNLEAYDADEGVNQEFEFFFTGSLDGADGEFTVLPNGSIISSSVLDREERVNYSFTVMVRDKGEPPKMSSGTVIVEVTDINDNSPAILFPKSQNHTIVISTLPETGVVISRIIAYDDDEGDNGNLKFTIVSGNEDKAFEISEATGEFKIAHSSRLKNRKQYEVGIVVSDKGIPPKINTTSLKIEIMYDNSTQVANGVKGKREDYIIIVAVVAAITVIFSTLIIVAICVVFQKDKNVTRKNVSKPAFHNVESQESLRDAEKVSSLGQNSTDRNSQQFSLNDLSSPPGNNQNYGNDNTFMQLQAPVQPDYQQSSKGKAVSFSLSELQTRSPPPRYPSPRNELPPFLTFGASFGGANHDDAFPHHSSMSRQVSGVTYAPVNTCERVGTSCHFCYLLLCVLAYSVYSACTCTNALTSF